MYFITRGKIDIYFSRCRGVSLKTLEVIFFLYIPETHTAINSEESTLAKSSFSLSNLEQQAPKASHFRMFLSSRNRNSSLPWIDFTPIRFHYIFVHSFQ